MAAGTTLNPQLRSAATPAAGGVRLNLGSGWNKLEGFVNLDRGDGGRTADMQCDLAQGLPDAIADNSVDAIYSHHFLEHLHHDTAARLLRSCLRKLKSRGYSRHVVPDAMVYYQLQAGLPQILMATGEKIDCMAVENPTGRPILGNLREPLKNRWYRAIRRSVAVPVFGKLLRAAVVLFVPSRITAAIPPFDYIAFDCDHKWIYSAPSLRALFEETGYSDIRIVGNNRTELLDTWKYDSPNSLTNSIHLECRKP
jgi:hypothetical protein